MDPDERLLEWLARAATSLERIANADERRNELLQQDRADRLRMYERDRADRQEQFEALAAEARLVEKEARDAR